MWKNKTLKIDEISVLSLGLYILSLFIFVHNTQLIIISEVLFLIFAVTTTIKVLIENKIKFHGFYIVLFIIMILSLTSYFWAIEGNITRILTLIQLFFLMFLVFNAVKTTKDINICLNSILYGGLIMSVYSIYFYGVDTILSSLYSIDRLGKEVNQINTFGYLSSITFIIAIYISIFKKKYIYLFISIIPLVFVIASGSRQSLLILVVGLLLIIIFKYAISSNKIFNSILLITILSLVAIILPILWNLTKDFEVIKRFTSLFNMFSNGDNVDSSALVRGNMIKFGLEQFFNKPIFGYGTEQYSVLYNQMFGAYRPSHNGYIRMLVEYGAVGFILYYGMFLYLLKQLLANVFKKGSHASVILLILLMLSLISDISSDSIYDKFTYIILAISFVQVNLFKNHNRISKSEL